MAGDPGPARPGLIWQRDRFSLQLPTGTQRGSGAGGLPRRVPSPLGLNRRSPEDGEDCISNQPGAGILNQ